MHDVKELDMTHSDAVLELWESSVSIAKTIKTDKIKEAFATSTEHYLTRNTPSRLIGAFANNELKAFLSMDKIYGFPYYSQGWLTVRPSKFFNPRKNGSSDCFAFMEQTGEENEWYRYYIHQADSKWQDWRNIHDPEQRYTVTIEEKIPKNGIPTNEAFWSMMGYQSWTVPTIIKSISLKPEFRRLQQ
jgi:hypothetical protein